MLAVFYFLGLLSMITIHFFCHTGNLYVLLLCCLNKVFLFPLLFPSFLFGGVLADIYHWRLELLDASIQPLFNSWEHVPKSEKLTWWSFAKHSPTNPHCTPVNLSCNKVCHSSIKFSHPLLISQCEHCPSCVQPHGLCYFEVGPSSLVTASGSQAEQLQNSAPLTYKGATRRIFQHER